MAQTFSLDIGFEYLVHPVKWTLRPAPNFDMWTGKDTGDWFIPSLVNGRQPRRADAWTARDEFFRLKNADSEGLLEFLNKWGPWHRFEDSFEDGSDIAVAANDVWQVRERFLKGIMSSTAEWLTDKLVNESPLAIFQPREEYPHCFFRATGCAIAMHTTITLNLLQRTEFRRCRRKDCDRKPVYPITSEHKRKYCCEYCGHLESLRKKRREARKAKKAAQQQIKKTARKRSKGNG